MPMLFWLPFIFLNVFFELTVLPTASVAEPPWFDQLNG
jgi:hypothetical protein